MPKINAVVMTTTCPHCGEPVEIVMTKKELKLTLQGMKLPLEEAQRFTERHLARFRVKNP